MTDLHWQNTIQIFRTHHVLVLPYHNSLSDNAHAAKCWQEVNTEQEQRVSNNNNTTSPTLTVQQCAATDPPRIEISCQSSSSVSHLHNHNYSTQEHTLPPQPFLSYPLLPSFFVYLYVL